MTSTPACCPEVRPLLADHLDGLLELADATRVEAHLATCTACARAAGTIRALATPWSVPDAPGDLPQRARAAFARLSPPRARAVVALRYAATFAAGVLVTLLFVRPEGTTPPVTPVVADAPAPQPRALTAPHPVDVPPTRRRIR
jgi:anti-sigma factor RsiW